MLTRASGITPAFRISSKAADTWIVEMADQLQVPELAYTWAEAEARRLAPRAHRAAADRCTGRPYGAW